MEETSNPTSQEAGRSVLGPVLWQEVLRAVIAPKLAAIVRKHGAEIENRQHLHRTFCEEWNIKPSYSTFSGWCEDLGISFRKRIEVSIPGWKEMPRPSPDFVGPMPAQPGISSFRIPTSPTSMAEEQPAADEPVVWDTPIVREIDPTNLDGMPDILPGGMRAPTFIGGNDFAN